MGEFLSNLEDMEKQAALGGLLLEKVKATTEAIQEKAEREKERLGIKKPD